MSRTCGVAAKEMERISVGQGAGYHQERSNHGWLEGHTTETRTTACTKTNPNYDRTTQRNEAPAPTISNQTTRKRTTDESTQVGNTSQTDGRNRTYQRRTELAIQSGGAATTNRCVCEQTEGARKGSARMATHLAQDDVVAQRWRAALGLVFEAIGLRPSGIYAANKATEREEQTISSVETDDRVGAGTSTSILEQTDINIDPGSTPSDAARSCIDSCVEENKKLVSFQLQTAFSEDSISTVKNKRVTLEQVQQAHIDSEETEERGKPARPAVGFLVPHAMHLL